MSDSYGTRTFNARHLKAVIEAERTGLPFLLWLDREGEQHILMLAEDRPRVTIGRREQSDIPLGWDPEVSRAHAMLEAVGEEWTLVDDGLSRNGSFVNGSRVHRATSAAGSRPHVLRQHPCHLPRGCARRRQRVNCPGHPARPRGVPLTEAQRKLLIALCRPIVESSTATPATNPQIAAEVHLSVDAVKAHMRAPVRALRSRGAAAEREADPFGDDRARVRALGARTTSKDARGPIGRRGRPIVNAADGDRGPGAHADAVPIGQRHIGVRRNRRRLIAEKGAVGGSHVAQHARAVTAALEHGVQSGHARIDRRRRPGLSPARRRPALRDCDRSDSSLRANRTAVRRSQPGSVTPETG